MYQKGYLFSYLLGSELLWIVLFFWGQTKHQNHILFFLRKYFFSSFDPSLYFSHVCSFPYPHNAKHDVETKENQIMYPRR